jgi:hypothetical protein
MAMAFSMRRIFAVACLLGILNFAAFVVGTFIVGGDAINGGSSCPAGGFYLWDKTEPDPCRQVSQSTYWYSKLHAYSVIVSWPIIIVASIYLNHTSWTGHFVLRMKSLPSEQRWEAWSTLRRRAQQAPRTATSHQEMKRLVDADLVDMDSGERKA